MINAKERSKSMEDLKPTFIGKESLNRIFQFLNENRSFNKEVQTRYYKSFIGQQKNTSDKVVSILYHIANTQSQPKIDYLAEFYKKIHQDIVLLDSFKGFMSILNPDRNEKNNYNGLFKAMTKQSGWGDKTAALFTKTIYHLHNEDYPEEYKIWEDAPKDLENDEPFLLPVDTVIIAIFNYLKPRRWDFKNINKEINNNYNGKEIEVWDDLWFWGFITQFGTGEEREMKWNLNKYWILKETNKNLESINKIKKKSEKFIAILSEERKSLNEIDY